jgi:hypothetical protein
MKLIGKEVYCTHIIEVETERGVFKVTINDDYDDEFVPQFEIEDEDRETIDSDEYDGFINDLIKFAISNK